MIKTKKDCHLIGAGIYYEHTGFSQIINGRSFMTMHSQPKIFAFALAVFVFSQIQPGRAADPYLVKDIVPGVESSPREASGFMALDNTLVFCAITPDHGMELWKSDGTQGGTVMVKDIAPGKDATDLRLMGAVNGVMLFEVYAPEASQGVWRSDGTDEGTVRIGPNLVCRSPGHGPIISAVLGKNLYFSADNYLIGRELYRSDGTVEGTYLIKDIKAGGGGSDPREITASGGAIYFRAYSDGWADPNLWKSARPYQDTAMFMEVAVDYDDPHNLTDVDGTLFFWIDSALWKSDGTKEGTVKVKDVGQNSHSGNDYQNGIGLDGIFYFRGLDYNKFGHELWRSDGTAQGTYMVKDIWPATSGSNPAMFTELNGVVLFIASDFEHGRELWRSDGTRDGTRLVKDIVPGGISSGISDLTRINDKVYFNAYDVKWGYELWQTDGTKDGTELVRDISPDFYNVGPRFLTAAGDMLYFFTDDGVHGLELWALGTRQAAVADAMDYE